MSAPHIDLSGLPPLETVPYLQDYHFPPYITLAHTFNAPKGWMIQTRYLSHYALQYVVLGAAEYEINGHVYLTRKGDVVIHRPYEPNAIRTIEGEPYICLSLLFHFGTSPFPFNDLFEQDHYCGNYVNHPVDRMLSTLVTHYQQPGLVHQVSCQGLLMQVLSELSTNVKKLQRPSKQKAAAKMVLIKNFIAERYNQSINFNQLEQISGLSQSYIIPLFKEMFDLSPMQYQIWLRIQKAKELALQTDLSVTEIAYQIGYADVHTFGKIFKRKTGHSLSDFCASLTFNPESSF